MSNVLGKNVVVRVYQNGWKLYGCASSCSLSVTASMVETSVTGSGKWATFAGQKLGWSGTLDGLVNFDQAITLYDLRVLQVNLTPLQIQYERVDGAGNSYTDTGVAYITDSSDTGQNDDVASFSIQLQGSGPLVQLLTLVGPPIGGRIFDDSFDNSFG